MNLLSRLLTPPANRFQATELFQTWQTDNTHIATSFPEYIQEGLNGTPVVAALVQVRIDIFSEVSFRWRHYKTKDWMEDTRGLTGLRHPYPGGHLSDLLALGEMDVQLAGNAFIQRHDDWSFERLRPDWIWVLSVPDGPGVLGYVYKPEDDVPGRTKEERVRFLDPDEVVHMMDMPDPLNPNLGRSWIRSCLVDINVDQASSSFVSSYFKNAATPNLIVKTPRELSTPQREILNEAVQRRYTGQQNAFKTMLLENGAEAMVVGSDLAAVEYATTRAAGETRIAAAAGVAPIVAGLREGLQSGTYSNYGQAVRKTLDWKIRPRWSKTVRHFERVLDRSRFVELWYDDSDIAAIQQDALDDAKIKSQDAATISSLITSGYEPDQIPAAVEKGDFTELTHTGLFSVQLQPPLTGEEAEGGPAEEAGLKDLTPSFGKRHTPGGHGHDQTTHGSWAKGGSVTSSAHPFSEINTSDQAAAHSEHGGSTFGLDGENKIGAPGMGAVGVATKRNIQIIIEKVTPRHIETYIELNKDIYSTNPNLAVGTWLDEDTGITHFDVVEVAPLADAIELGTQHNQIAIFDLEHFEEIPTGGTGSVPGGYFSEDIIKDFAALRHGKGSHDDEDHGNWADGAGGSGESSKALIEALIEQSDREISENNTAYLAEYARMQANGASWDELQAFMLQHRDEQRKLIDKRHDLIQEQERTAALENIRIADAPLESPEHFGEMTNDFNHQGRKVQRPIRDPSYPEYGLDLSEAGVRQRVKAIRDQFGADLGRSDLADVEIVPTWDEWHQVAHAHIGADAYYEDGTVYLGPRIVRDLATEPMDADSMRVVAHELAHGVSANVGNLGAAQVMEEGGAEILSMHWTLNRADNNLLAAEAARPAIGKKADGYTKYGELSGSDAVLYNVVYADRVEETILQSARRNGWDAGAMRKDIIHTFTTSEDTRGDFFDNSDVRIYKDLFSKGGASTGGDPVVAAAWHDAMLASAPEGALDSFDHLGDGAGLPDSDPYGETLPSFQQRKRTASLLKWMLEVE